MPDYFFYQGTSSDTEWSTVSFTATQILQDFEQSQHQREQEERVWERQWEEQQAQIQEERRLAKELKEDKKKYPLFFLKEGIV